MVQPCSGLGGANCKTREGLFEPTSTSLETKTPKDPGERRGLAYNFLSGVGPHRRAPRKGKWKNHPPDREAVTGTGGGGGHPTWRRSVAAAAFLPSPFFPKGVWGPRWCQIPGPAPQLLPPIPRGCCLLGLKDLIPHSPTPLPQGMGPLSSKSLSQTLGPQQAIRAPG